MCSHTVQVQINRVSVIEANGLVILYCGTLHIHFSVDWVDMEETVKEFENLCTQEKWIKVTGILCKYNQIIYAEKYELGEGTDVTCTTGATK